MFVKLTKHKKKDGSIKTQIQLVESYRPYKGAKPKQRCIENYGYLEDQKDPEAFLLKLREEVKKISKEKLISIAIDTNKKIDDISNRDLNFGPSLLDNIYDLLKLDKTIDGLRDSKAEYDLKKIFRFLIKMQVIRPDSKRSLFMDIDHIYDNSHNDFDIHHIYRSLDELCAIRHELLTSIQKRLDELLNIDHSFHYLDATNFYFEKDFALEDTLPQKGVSKEHRTEPIVQFGLLLNELGLPFYSECFKGNTSDCKILEPMYKNIRGNCKVKGKLVCVADKGLNTMPNIDFLANNGDGYLFKQSLKGKKNKRYHDELFSDEGWTFNSCGTYRYKTYIEEINGKDKDGKKITRKQRVLLYWMKAQDERCKRKREEKIKRANKALTNNAYLVDHSKNAYLKSESYTKKDGEFIETDSIYSLDEEKITNEVLFDGYDCIVTSELDYDEKKMREVYSNLWLIENSFRIEKSDLKARAVYLRTDDHIRAHFLICHIALLFIRLIQLAMGKDMISAERIQRVLSDCVLDEIAKGYLHIHEPSQKNGFVSYNDIHNHKAYSLRLSGKDEVFEDFKLLNKALGINIDKAYYKKEEFKRILKKAKLTLQYK